MNIFEALEKYAEENKQGPFSDEIQEQDDELDEYGKDSNGIYRTEYAGRSYSQLCRDATGLYEDSFDGDSEAELNID